MDIIVGNRLTLVLQYGKLLKDLSSGANDTMVATFADGSTAEGTLVVGCDGANSVVRHCVLDESAAHVEDLDIQMLNVSCTFPKDTAMLQRMGHPVFKNSYHPDGFMWWQSIQDVEDPMAPETWLFQNVISWIGEPRAEQLPDAASRIKYWKEKAETFAEPWRTVGRDLPDDFPVPLDRTTVWRPTVDWSGKFGHRVTLSGDAAHAMPPHRGQGLNNALQDAAVLVDELKAVKAGDKSLSDAIAAFEKDMKERTLQEIPISIAQVSTLDTYWCMLRYTACPGNHFVKRELICTPL